MQGIVFDLDGVLAASMPQHAEAFRRALADEQVPVEDRRVFELEGARSESVIRQLAADAGLELSDQDVARIAEAKQAAFRAQGIPRLHAGAQEMVHAAQGFARGLVTGTRAENVRRVLGPMANLFDVMLAADGYTHEKPHPEPYATAAQELGLEPEMCLAVENAPFGIQSARQAGYGLVWAVTTTMPAASLDADQVFDTQADVARQIGKLAAKELR